MASCSIILSWFLARVPGLVSLLFWHPVPSSFPGFRGLSPYFSGILFHHHFLVPGLVSLLFWHPVPSSFPGILFHHPFLVPARVPGLASLYSFGILFHHPVLVPARVPGLVSLLFWHPVPSSFLVPARVPGLVSLLFWHPVPSSFHGSGWGSGACCPNGSGAEWGSQLFQETVLFHHDFLVPGILAFCSIIISSVLLVSGRVPGVLSLVFSIFISRFRLGFRGLSP